jgi:hypothetical protein
VLVPLRIQCADCLEMRSGSSLRVSLISIVRNSVVKTEYIYIISSYCISESIL